MKLEINQRDFNLWKKQALSKLDKSNIGSIDIRIKKLCDLINNRNDMFTLSSCSGRICLLNRVDFKKQENIWLYVNHNKANSKEIISILNELEIEKSLNDIRIEFRQESAIIHICVNSLDLARILMDLGRKSGFNNVGIIAIKNKIVVELICDSKLILPIYDNGKLVSDQYIDYLINQANLFLEKSWDSIKKLEENIINLK